MTTYEVDCEGCRENVCIEIDGYIGTFDDVWCEVCGYEGENVSYEPLDLNPQLCLQDLKNIHASMTDTNDMKGPLGLTLALIEKHPGNTLHIQTANRLVRSKWNHQRR